MKRLFFAFLFFYASLARALEGDFSGCTEQFFAVPKAAHSVNHYALCFSGFAVQYNGERKTPVFSAAMLDRARIVAAKAITRAPDFYEEARLPKRVRALLSDYKRSGYDRGHMYPSGDSHTNEASIQSMSLANIAPQSGPLNRGLWAKIEQDVRRYVLRASGPVYTLTGPAYWDVNTNEPLRKSIYIGQGVAIPTHIWKVVFDPEQDKTIVYWVANQDHVTVPDLIDLKELGRRTELDFSAHLKTS
jgi:endonuclease G